SCSSASTSVSSAPSKHSPRRMPSSSSQNLPVLKVSLAVAVLADMVRRRLAESLGSHHPVPGVSHLLFTLAARGYPGCRRVLEEVPPHPSPRRAHRAGATRPGHGLGPLLGPRPPHRAGRRRALGPRQRARVGADARLPRAPPRPLAPGG